MNYSFEIKQAAISKDMLDLSVMITCPNNEKALSPKIRLLFSQGGKTRRLPIIIDERRVSNDMCEIYASYRYFLSKLFCTDVSGDISLSFSFSYADEEIDNLVISGAEGVDNSISVCENRIIIKNSDDIARAKRHSEFISVSYSIKHIIAKLANAYYKLLCKKYPVVENRVTFMSGRRNSLGGNQLFVYNQMKENKDIDFQFLMFSSSKGHYRLKNLKRFLKLYATSRVVVIDDFFRLLNAVDKRDEVKLIQLWHACGAFKSFGFTRLGKAGAPRQLTKSHRMYDYVTVSSQNIARHYAEGFGLSDENIMATGVARTDIFADGEYAEGVRQRLYSKYPSLKNKKVIMYAPTFRGNGQMSAYFPLEVLDVEKLYNDLGGEYSIIIKLHPFCKERYLIDKGYKDFIIDMSDEDELNDILFITDLLVTDYSSVVFEASLLNIPMLFYSYDLQEYVSQRDFYYEYEYFVPGKIVYNQHELTQSILNSDFEESRVIDFRNKFFDDIDGQSSQRISNKIMDILRGKI